MSAKDIVKRLLEKADIKINGSNPWDITVNDNRIFDRVIKYGTLGLGEGYMDGWWSSKKLDQTMFKLITADLKSHLKANMTELIRLLMTRYFNFQTGRNSFKVGKVHYDLGNSLYEKMLDPYMMYSCAYWKNAKDLNSAQINKMQLVCDKLNLKPGMKVLDIGCGWGGMLRYAAQKYGINGLGITISKEQQHYAQAAKGDLSLNYIVKDYRKLDPNKKFDAIISIGMFEHVGYKNYKTYMKTTRNLLKDRGLFLLHTIADNLTSPTTDPWIAKYIFPNSALPSLAAIGKAMENYYIIEDLHNFGPYYDNTLMAWYDNFKKSWVDIKDQYNERFFRMWEYYLMICAAVFRSRTLQLWQIVLSKGDINEVYPSIR